MYKVLLYWAMLATRGMVCVCRVDAAITENGADDSEKDANDTEEGAGKPPSGQAVTQLA